ncbi:hypothetical protein PENTCL1PPCAC_2552, partial [Pristionchus entomophagus]
LSSPSTRRFLNGIRDYKKIALSAQFAWKYRDVADKYRLESLGPRHFNHMMDLSKGFFETESLTQATGSTIDNFRKGMECMLAYSIAAQSVSQNGWICYDKETNEPIGFRLSNPVYRDPKKAPFSFPESTLSEQEITLFTPLDEIFNKIWNIYPDEDIIYKGEIAYIALKHRKCGLYKVLIDYGVSFPRIAEETGAKYFAIMCTANITKAWYNRNGYKIVYKSPSVVKNAKGEMVPMKDGSIWLMTCDMRDFTTVDVYPFWRYGKTQQ